jgi:hypothetical protein
MVPQRASGRRPLQFRARYPMHKSVTVDPHFQKDVHLLPPNRPTFVFFPSFPPMSLNPRPHLCVPVRIYGGVGRVKDSPRSVCGGEEAHLALGPCHLLCAESIRQRRLDGVLQLERVYPAQLGCILPAHPPMVGDPTYSTTALASASAVMVNPEWSPRNADHAIGAAERARAGRDSPTPHSRSNRTSCTGRVNTFRSDRRCDVTSPSIIEIALMRG